MKWKITYFSETVLKTIKAFSKELKGDFIFVTDKMMEKGPDLGMPRTKAMGKGLFEIRLNTKDNIARAFYCVKWQNEIIILHAFIKKTQKTPKKEIDLAFKRLNEVKKHD